MKKCPQCQSVFTPETIYCLNDGALLLEEKLEMPSSYVTKDELGEEVTLVRSEPIVIDHFNDPEPVQPTVQFEQPPVIVQPAPAPAPSRGPTYLLFLLIGLLIGAGLVIGGLLLAMSRDKGANNTAAPNVNQQANTNVPVASEKHLVRNKTRQDSDFNGTVETENANLRSAPNAGVQDVLPKGDRIEIIEREASGGPWYRVMCEHGVTGWMHGNTIKFADGAETF